MESKTNESKEIIPEEENKTLALFGTNNPKMIVKMATAVADELKPIIVDRQLYTMIGKKPHVWVEGWTLLGSLLGGFPQLTVEDLSDPQISLIKFNAVCEVRSLDGKLITKAEGKCSNEESKWKKADEYAIESMAQTRATSKAMRMAFGWIMKLAGYEPTPAEEIDKDTPLENEPLNGDGEVDKHMAALEKGVGGKKADETVKEYMIRKIDWLRGELQMGELEFKAKVKDIKSLGTQTQNELDDILSALYKKHFYGKTIKKISVATKK